MPQRSVSMSEVQDRVSGSTLEKVILLSEWLFNTSKSRSAHCDNDSWDSSNSKYHPKAC